MRQGSTHIRRRIGLAVAIVCAAAMFSAPASAGSGRLSDSGRFSGSQATVDHDGIYLAQRIGQCLNRSGPCYFGGQCPGGEYTSSAYTNGRVYCSSFYLPEPYPPSIFQRLLGIP